MPPEDKNKLNRLEELKSKLFNKGFRGKTEHRDTFSRPSKKDVMDSWQAKEKSDSGAIGEQFLMQTSTFKKFFIFSIVFFVAALSYASYVFFAGGNTVSNETLTSISSAIILLPGEKSFRSP